MEVQKQMCFWRLKMYMLQEILLVIHIGLKENMQELNIKMKLLDKGICSCFQQFRNTNSINRCTFFRTNLWDRTLAYSEVGQGYDEAIIDGDLNQQKFIVYHGKKDTSLLLLAQYFKCLNDYIGGVKIEYNAKCLRIERKQDYTS